MAKTSVAKSHGSKLTPLELARAARKPKDPNAPPETREQKLERLANARVNKACKYIKLIGNLAAYKPTPSQIEQIMQALGMACASVNNRLDGVRAESIVFTINKG